MSSIIFMIKDYVNIQKWVWRYKSEYRLFEYGLKENTIWYEK